MSILTTDVKSLNAVRLFSRKDSAIDHDATDWDAYDEDPLKEDLIKMKEGKEATVFLCNFEFKGKDAVKVKDAVFGGMDKDSGSPKINYSNWAYEVVRNGLKDIQNPVDITGVIKLKKDSGKYVSPETMTKLESVGLVSEIFKHWMKLKTDDGLEDNAKN